MDIYMVIGNIPFKPKKGFVLPRHRFTGPYNLLHLQLGSKDNHYQETSHIMLSTVYPFTMTFAIEIIQLVNMNVIIKC